MIQLKKPSKKRAAAYLFVLVFILMTLDIVGHKMEFPHELAFLKNYMDPSKNWAQYWSFVIVFDLILFAAHYFLWEKLNKPLKVVSFLLLFILTTLTNYSGLRLFVPHSRHITQFVYYRDLFKQEAQTGDFGKFTISNYSGEFDIIKTFISPADLEEVKRVMQSDFRAELQTHPSKP